MSVIGTAVSRTDATAKLTGTAVYTVDYEEPGQLYGRLLRSPVPSGRIVSLDTSAATTMAGVHAIVTAADTPGNLAGWVLREQPLFATEFVRYEGEPVAAVVADSEEQAIAAVTAIALKIEELPTVGDLQTALDETAPLVHPDWEDFIPVSGQDHPRRDNIAAELISDPGNVDDAFSQAHRVIEDRFTSARQYQAYIEPKSAVGIYRDGRYIVHTGHQFPFNIRDRIAQYLDYRPSDVRVIGHAIGGGFGAKLDASLEPYAVILSKAAAGRPVKIVNSRAEDMLSCPCRENAIVRVRSGLDADGNIIARELVCDMDNGAYTGEMAWMPSIAMHIAGSVYRIGTTRVIARLHYTNTAPTGAMRGVSGVYLYAALERHMDHIAQELGVDRRDFRLRHLFEDGDQLLNGQRLPDAGILRDAFDAVERVAPWAHTRKPKRPYRGTGLAAAIWLTNPMPGSVIIKLNEDGTANVITAANDNGSGAVSMGLTQIVAEELGLRPTEIRISEPDTDNCGFDGGSQGSRTTQLVGRAAMIAAAEVKTKIFEAAANLLEANPSDLVLRDGKVCIKGDPSAAVPLASVATAATWGTGPVVGTGSYTTPAVSFNPGCASGLLFPFMPTPTYHVHLAEVEINPITGNVRVVRYVVAQEVGKVINPVGVRGQIQGAVAQGIGHALYESLRIQDSRYVERTLESYRLPLAIDTPEVEVITLEHPNTDGPYGAKGVGEPAILLPAAVIANAVSDAIGKPFNAIPITPEDVLAALDGE